jgi:hypothetical protein
MTQKPECEPREFKSGVWPSAKDRTREFLAELVRLIDADAVRIDNCTLDSRHTDFTIHVEGRSK